VQNEEEDDDEKTKKLKRNIVHSYLEIGWSDLLQIWYVGSPTLKESLQQILFNSYKRSQSYTHDRC